MSLSNRQTGGSVIGLILMLAVIGYGAYIAIQYVPQYIESNSVDSILDSLVEKNQAAPINDMSTLQSTIDNQLYVNEMSELKSAFSIRRYRGAFEVTVRYERELNLVYENKVITYEKRVMLE